MGKENADRSVHFERERAERCTRIERAAGHGGRKEGARGGMMGCANENENPHTKVMGTNTTLLKCLHDSIEATQIQPPHCISI